VKCFSWTFFRASIPFSLPDFTIVFIELWNEIRGWALHSCSLIGTFITSDTSMTWYPNQGNRVSGIDELRVVYDEVLNISKVLLK